MGLDLGDGVCRGLGGHTRLGREGRGLQCSFPTGAGEVSPAHRPPGLGPSAYAAAALEISSREE